MLWAKCAVRGDWAQNPADPYGCPKLNLRTVPAGTDLDPA
jgi:hypothetical protein